MDRHLIIGGNGYVGSAMSEYLINNSNISVRVLDVNVPENKKKNVDYKQGSICNKKIIRDSLSGVTCVHFYAVHIPFGAKNDDILKVNIDGLKNVLEESIKQGIKKIIIVSSSTMYGGNKEALILDDTIPNPSDIYGKVRLQAEKLAMQYSKKGLNIIIFRPHIIAGGKKEGIFSNTFNRISSNKNVWLPYTSKYIHQLIHIDDLIDAIVKSFDYDCSEIFNIGQIMDNNMYDLISKLIKDVDSRSKIRLMPRFILDLFGKLDIVFGTSLIGPNKILFKDNGFYFESKKIRDVLEWNEKYKDYEILKESYHNYIQVHKNVFEGGNKI